MADNQNIVIEHLHGISLVLAVVRHSDTTTRNLVYSLRNAVRIFN